MKNYIKKGILNILYKRELKNKPKKGNLVQDRAGQAIKQINSTAVKEKREKDNSIQVERLVNFTSEILGNSNSYCLL